MQEEQSGNENQDPQFVGHWSPLPADATPEDERDDAGTPSPDASPGTEGSAPLIGPFGGSPGQPGGYAQPGGFAEPGYGPGYGQSGSHGQPGGLAQPGGYAQSGGFGQPGGYGEPGGFGQPGGHGQSGGFSQAGGFGSGGYGSGGYGSGGYGSGGYGSGGYGQPGGFGGPPGDFMGPPPPPRRPGWARGILVYVVVAALAAGIGAAAVAVFDHNSAQNQPNAGSQNPSSGNGANPGTGLGNGSSSGGVSSTQEQAIAKKIEPGIVDIASDLQYAGGTAAATGMVISSSGLVLTNNHVIDDTTGLTATLVTTGQKFTARWLGYDKTDDVSVIKLDDASGLPTVPLGDSSSVKVGDNVVAIGNAGGTGGTPSVVTGSITALNQTITASDDLGGSETLHDMLQTNADIVEGDSGGPLVNASSQVIGMDTAASSASFGNQSPTAGFAIPINHALSIANQIIAGKASSTIKIGASGFMGVLVPSGNASTLSSPAQQQQQQLSQGNGGSSGSGSGQPGAGQQCLESNENAAVPQTIAPVGTGTLVLGALCGTPASTAGIAAGDVITSVGGHAVSTPDSLTTILQTDRPGQVISVTWTDTAGTQHTSKLDLLQAPPQ
jgi:S1-C subfamily serine protease